MGIFQKLRVITLGNLHELLNKTIDLNSPAVLEQYIRDLEDAITSMKNEAATQAGLIRTLEREVGDLQHNIDSETDLVKRILAGSAANKDTASRIHAANVVRMQKELPEKQAQLETQRKTSAAIDDAVAKLDAKHADMVNQARSLRRLDRETKAKEHAAGAMEAAGKIVSDIDGASIDDIKGKMQERHDVADVKFERAMDSVQVEEDPTTAGDVDALLATLGSK